VRCLKTGEVEWVGPLEQLFLNVSASTAERRQAHALLKRGGEAAGLPEQLPLRYSHEELEPTRMLSLLAGLTPFSNHNQSPRNMYQCQMLKQTMGTPYHNHIYRTDNKVFRIMNPQRPLVRTKMYEAADCDLHPVGTNAVVAVITYTGYDMEDAMIVSKASYNRGFAQGQVYKSKIVEAAGQGHSAEERRKCRFANPPKGSGLTAPELDADGLPPVGTYLRRGDPLYCTVDHNGRCKVESYHEEEPGYVEQASLVDGAALEEGACQRLLLKLRHTRNPVVGDKFSSRHGQKGVMSLLWPQEDMPFTESGITPDILFNPHGFPSRMTIGMLIESIAGKAAAHEAHRSADGTSFRGYRGRYGPDGNEADPFLREGQRGAAGPTAAEYFGGVLAENGFQRLGTERMYSGIHGTELETEIFVGVIYYQRLRHLVMDKAQARARGPNDRITNQPVKGRKRGGGIRFGEMERDSLLAHGASFLLHDRLMRCSDFDVSYVCPLCGSVLSPQANTRDEARPGEQWECPPCTRSTGRAVRCHPLPVPWIFRYLACEMAAMNVKMKLTVTDRARAASFSQPRC